MGRHLSPRYSQVILVSGYLVLTAVNGSQHWRVSVFLCSDPKLVRKYETEHWSRSSKIINWSADSFQINHMSPRQLSIDHIVNVQCKRCGLGKTRLRHPSLPFDSLPYPTRTICRRVRTYLRTYAGGVTWQPNEKRLPIFYEYGALSPLSSKQGGKNQNSYRLL